MYENQAMLQKAFWQTTSLSKLYNHFGPTKLFSDLYLAKFLDILVKPFFSWYFDKSHLYKSPAYSNIL